MREEPVAGCGVAGIVTVSFKGTDAKAVCRGSSISLVQFANINARVARVSTIFFMLFVITGCGM